jgi:hypothetical protein
LLTVVGGAGVCGTVATTTDDAGGVNAAGPGVVTTGEGAAGGVFTTTLPPPHATSDTAAAANIAKLRVRLIHSPSALLKLCRQLLLHTAEAVFHNLSRSSSTLPQCWKKIPGAKRVVFWHMIDSAKVVISGTQLATTKASRRRASAPGNKE